MADQNSRVELEITVDDSDVIESARRTRKAYENINQTHSKGLKQQKETVKDVTKMKSKTESPAALRKVLDASRKRLQTEKETLRVMRQQEQSAKRMMRSGGTAAGPLSIFGGQPNSGGFGGGMAGLMGMGAGKAGRRAMRGLGRLFGGMGRGGMGMLGRMGGPLGMLASLLGTAGTFTYGAVSSKIKAGHGMQMQQQGLLAGLAGGGTNRIAMERAQNLGAGYGYGPMDTLEQARSAARQTGNARSVTTAQAFARSSMMDVGETSGVMGSLARGGTKFTGTASGAGSQQMKRWLADVYSTGLDKSRAGEALTGLGQVVDVVGGRVGGDVNAKGIGDLLGAIGSTGKSGLTGKRGISVMQQLGQAIQNPGGGEHGQALMLQALGFGKPGGNTTYYDAVRTQQEGLNNPDSVYKLFGETQRQTGGGQEQALLLSRMTNLTISQVELLRDALKDTAGMSKEQRDEKIAETLKGMKPIEEQGLAETKNMASLLEQMRNQELDTLRASREASQYLLNIQDTTNDYIRQFLPLAKRILEALDALWRMFVNSTMFGSQEEKSKYKAGKLTEIQAKYDMGQMTEEEAAAAMAEVQKGQNRSHSTRTLNNTGARARAFQDALNDGVDLTTLPGYGDLSPKAKEWADKYSAAAKTPGQSDDIKVREELSALPGIVKELAEHIILMSSSVTELTTEQRATANPSGTSVPPPQGQQINR